jgi:hypothetical protein
MRSLLCLAFVATAASIAEAPPLVGQRDADRFILHLSEGPDPTLRGIDHSAEPVLYLRILTERSYNCLLPLDIRVEQGPRSTAVVVNGIAPVDLCAQAVGPASGFAFLPRSAGRYALLIEANGRADRYVVSITDEWLRVAPPSGSFTRFEHSEYRRAPRYSAAVYCRIPWKDESGPDPDRRWICDAFFDLIQERLHAQEMWLAVRPGGAPYPLRNDMRPKEIRYLQFQGPDDFDRAGAVLQEFTRDVNRLHGGSMFIEMLDWRGRLIHSY